MVDHGDRVTVAARETLIPGPTVPKASNGGAGVELKM